MIKQLHLKNFTCFSNNTFTFCKGINVFIGENAVGKTHLLKVLAANIDTYLFESARLRLSQEKEKINHVVKIIFEQNLYDFFKQETNDLIAKNAVVSNIEATFDIGSQGFSISSTLDKKNPDNEGSIFSHLLFENFNYVFIPSKEMLSFFKGFISLYHDYVLGFDRSYYLLAQHLNVPPLTKQTVKDLNLPPFVSDLKSVLGEAEVVNENGIFYLKTNESKTEINLVAEGWRKIATLIYLILNGELELSENSVLFIDEPEANLNPKLIETMARFLVKIANKGVQIFIASHDYLLCNYLSVFSENRALFEKKQEPIPDIKFFSLHKKDDNEGISIETSHSLLGLETAIMSEFSRFYENEKNWSHENLKI